MSAKYPITAVFLDGTTPSDGSEPLLPFAQDLEVPRWTDGRLSVTCVGGNGSAYNITGGALIFTARTRNQAAPPVISREGVITSGSGGLAYVDIGSVDVGIDVQTLAWSLAFVDSDGKVWASTAQGSFAVTAAEYVPGQDVTVPESQQPLAQGPAGANTFRYTVSQPTDGADFTVAIPAAAQVGSANYGVNVTTASEAALAVFGAPIAERTSSAVRIIASDAPDDATVLEITVYELVS